MSMIKRRQPEAELSTQRGLDPFAMMQELMRWDPFRELSQIGGSTSQFVPRFEVKERRDAYVFKADLPGVREEDLDISLTGNRLTVSGHREEEKRNDDERFFTYERSYGSFTRTFSLPEDVDGEHCDAELKDGVLTLTLGKKPEMQPKRIAVSTGGKGDKQQLKA